MTEPFRSVSRWLHHLPWIAAGVVLAAGLVVYALRPAPQRPMPMATEAEAPEFHMDEAAFRQALKLDELYESSGLDEDR